MLYIASPYTHADPKITEQRYHETCLFTGALMQAGVNCFSPIAHCHEIARMCMLPTDCGFWQKHNEMWLARSTGLIVLMLPGWKESIGIKHELSIAAKLNLPIFYMQPGLSFAFATED